MVNWLEQKNEPLFPDVIWSRPETKQGSGKLLIVGGSAGAMAHLASAYAQAESAGAGTIRLLVPNSLAKVTKHIPHIEYAPSTPSGSFAKSAIADLLAAASWSDGVLLAGDMGKNSETNLMLDNFVASFSGLLFISSENVESFSIDLSQLAERENTTLFLSFRQLQILGTQAKLQSAFTSDMTRPKLADSLRELSTRYPANLVAQIDDWIWVARGSRVATCEKSAISAANSTVWLIQQPTRPFESLVSSLF